tara:strand:- start:1721 stop:2968 length:1248 start_codon:yes stop_codon:yes gene_type:complete
MLATFPALQSREFRKLFYSYVMSSAAQWALLLGRGWLIFELTGSTSAVGLVTFGGMAPLLFFGPIFGPLADSLDRRKMAIIAASAGVLTSTILSILTLSGVVAMWHVVVIAILQGTAMAAITPPSEAMIPSLVPKIHLLSAVAIRGTARHGSKVLGPFIGGVIMSAFENGTGWVFVVGALFFLLAGIQLYRINYQQTPKETENNKLNINFITPMLEAAAYSYQDKRLFLVLSLLGMHCGFTMAFDSLLPGIADSVGAGKETYSAITVAVGAGALITTLYVSSVSEEAKRGPIFFVTAIGSGIGILIIGLATSPLMAIIGGFVAGATQAPYMSVSATLIQQVVPDELRGRVMAFYIMIAAGFMAFMNLGFGLLADITGERILCIIPGGIWLAYFMLASLTSFKLRYLMQKGNFLRT